MAEVYLSRLRFDPRQRAVWRAMADCRALHTLVMAAFPAASGAPAREAFGVLHRLEMAETGPPVLLVQSAVAPDWSLPASAGALVPLGRPPEVKAIEASLAAIGVGQRLRFRLRANPTKRIHANHAGTDRLAGKRVDLRDEQSQLDWLGRKGEQHGFAVVAATTRPGAPGGKEHGRTGGGAGARLTFGAVLFEGVLEVVEAERFLQALRDGIGSGKAYGFGLLSVAPTR